MDQTAQADQVFYKFHNVNFSFLTLVDSLQSAAESDNLCPVSIAASLWAKSLKMTVSLHRHIIAWLACTLNDFCRIVVHWFLDMSTCPKCLLLCLYCQLCKCSTELELDSRSMKKYILLNMESNCAWSQIWQPSKPLILRKFDSVVKGVFIQD